MGDWFLERTKAKLAIAELLGFLDRWIRRRLREASDVELWGVQAEVHKRTKVLASLDSPTKMPSMGARMRAWREYPLKKYLDAEQARRFDERVKADPKFYWVPTDDLTNEELDEYIRWKQNTPPDALKGLSLEDQMAKWRREGRRVLPVIPRPGSLPSNAHVRRPPNHREGSGHPGRSSKAGGGEEDQTPVRKEEDEGYFPIEDRYIH